MAVIKATRLNIPGVSKADVFVYKWASVLAADTFDAIALPAASDRSVQVVGTFDSGTVVIQGANDSDSPTYATLNDSRGEGNALSFTSADLRQILEITTLVKPAVSGGGGSQSLDVILTAVRRG